MKYISIVIIYLICLGCQVNNETDKIILSIFRTSKTKILKIERISPDGWIRPFVVFAKVEITKLDYNNLINSLPYKCDIALSDSHERMAPFDLYERKYPVWYQPNFNLKSDYMGFYDIKSFIPDSCSLTCRYNLQYEDDYCYLMMDCRTRY